MDTAQLEHRLALVERQIVDAERHATLRRDIIIRLELDGLSTSDTAAIARDRLRQIEAAAHRRAEAAASGAAPDRRRLGFC